MFSPSIPIQIPHLLIQRAKDTYLVYQIRASLAKYCESLAFLGQNKNSAGNEVQTEHQRLQRLSQTSTEGLKRSDGSQCFVDEDILWDISMSKCFPKVRAHILGNCRAPLQVRYRPNPSLPLHLLCSRTRTFCPFMLGVGCPRFQLG